MCVKKIVLKYKKSVLKKRSPYYGVKINLVIKIFFIFYYKYFYILVIQNPKNILLKNLVLKNSKNILSKNFSVKNVINIVLNIRVTDKSNLPSHLTNHNHTNN